MWNVFSNSTPLSELVMKFIPDKLIEPVPFPVSITSDWPLTKSTSIVKLLLPTEDKLLNLILEILLFSRSNVELFNVTLCKISLISFSNFRFELLIT